MVPASNLNWCPLYGNFDKISKRSTTCGITSPFSVTNSQHQHMTILDMIQSLFHLRWHKMNTYSRLHICINGTSTLGLPVVTFPFVVSPPTLHMQSRSYGVTIQWKHEFIFGLPFPFCTSPPTSHHTVSVMGVYCDEQRIHHHVPVPVINPAVMFNFTINMETGNDIHLYTRYCLFKWTPSHQHNMSLWSQWPFYVICIFIWRHVCTVYKFSFCIL